MNSNVNPIKDLIPGVTVILLAAQWLWPFAGGPSAAVEPLLWGLGVASLWFVCVTGCADVTPRRSLQPIAIAALIVGWALASEQRMLAGAAAAILMAMVGLRGGQYMRQIGPSAVQAFAGAWLLAGLLSAVLAVIQYAGYAELFRPWINVPIDGRSFANLRQANQFATLTNIALMALLYLVATEPPQPQRRRIGLPVVAALLLAVANVMSSSRTGLVQLVGVFAMCWRWGLTAQSGVRTILIATAIAYGVASGVLPWLAASDGGAATGAMLRVATEDLDCLSRITLWSNVLHLISLRPWLGWGWGELDYAHFMTVYETPRFCMILDNAHSLPLQLAVELGIPLAVAALGLIGWAVWRGVPWRERLPARQLAWGVLALTGLHSLLEYPLWYAPFQLTTGICIGLLWPRGAPGGDLAIRRSAWPGRLLSVMLLMGCAIVAWDYWRVSQIYRPAEARAAAYREDTLAKVRHTWFFQDQARFAELTLTPLTRGNAEWTFHSASALLHYSPEPRVVEKLIESAVMLGCDDLALAYLQRYRAAFPAHHARWALAQGLPEPTPPAVRD